MTWKEYKDMRLTVQERLELANNIQTVSQSVNDRKMLTGHLERLKH